MSSGMMPRLFVNFNNGYLVYIAANKYKKTIIGFADEMNGFTVGVTKKFSRLVYFEKFNDRKKALIKKRFLERSDKEKIKEIVSKSNPEWLNLIFTLTGEANYYFNKIVN